MKENYKDYLLEEVGITEKTSRTNVRCQTAYCAWLKEQGYTIERLNYAQLMDYIGQLQKQGTSKDMINKHLRAISHYHNYLQLPNIAKDVRMRGIIQEAFLPLSAEELDTIYHNWEDPNERYHYHHSNKLMLSLLIYQALTGKEIYRITLDHINLKEGTLYIASSRLKSRVVPLVSHQIIPFYEYIHQHRGKSKNWQHWKEEDQNKLFSPNANHLRRIELQTQIITKQIKKLNPNIPYHSLYQLRKSRLAIWIKEYGLKEAQYLGGFSRIIKVERYKNQDVESLKEAINKYHPLS